MYSDLLDPPIDFSEGSHQGKVMCCVVGVALQNSTTGGRLLVAFEGLFGLCPAQPFA